MKFRITHLIAITTLVAFIAWVLSTPSEWTLGILEFVGWLTILVLAVRAVSRPGRERQIIVAGLLGSVSYLVLVNWDLVDFPTTYIVKILNPRLTREVVQTPLGIETNNYFKPGYEHFHVIGEMMVAVIIGLMMASLSAYWTRSKGGVVDNA
jgi:hypothetical protein